MKNLIFITNKYPNPIEENVLVFLQQLVWEMSNLNNKCTVVCPVPVNINPKYYKLPYKKTEKTENGNTISVYFPKYIGFGQSEILGYNPAKITTSTFTKAVKKVIKKLDIKPDALYGHFITPAGIAAARIGKKLNIPSFCAYGESTPWTIEHFGVEKTRKELKAIDGIVAVSTHNKNELLELNVVKEEKVGVFPNGYRPERFYPRDKDKSREMFGLPKDKFIVSFVGSFDHRKGVERLIEAVEGLDDVYVICAGKGRLTPNSDRCLYQSPVNHKDLPYFYSASDIFVLPTLNEGCSNAIIEAMACGLPIVSSKLPFNDNILDKNNSLLIIPKDIHEIKKSIKTLKKNEKLRKELNKGSLEKAKALTLDRRTKKILKFMSMSI